MGEIRETPAEETQEIAAEENQEIPAEETQEIQAEENLEVPVEEIEGAGAVAAELGEIFDYIKKKKKQQ